MKEINVRDIKENPVSLINDGWGLLTAGDENGWDTMTVSWGAIGELWNKDVAIAFVRPQRYTKEFIDVSERFSLSFFDEDFRQMLNYFGTVSGRDENKISKSAPSPLTISS